jgi:nitroreductase
MDGIDRIREDGMSDEHGPPWSDLDTEPWQVRAEDYPREGPLEARAAFLLRYAVLAPSSHNAQPWRFRVDGRRIHLFADPSGWLEVADPDGRELYLSLGCAAENLVVAARHFGFRPTVSWAPGREWGGGTGPGGTDTGDAAPEGTVLLDGDGSGPGGGQENDSLFPALTERHTNHGTYDGRPVPESVRRRLEGAVHGDDIQIHLTDDPEVRRQVDDLTVRADALQFADPAWRRELGRWLARGVFGQGWILSRIARLAVTHLDLGRSTGRKDRALLDSASLLGVVTAPERSRIAALEAGRVFQRLFLTATAEGLALQPMNQVLQVEEVREEFEALLPEGWGRPQITVRLGYADAEEHTPRLPLEAVLEAR